MALSPAAVFESFNPLHNGWSCVLESPLEVHTARTLSEVVPLLQEADRAARDGLWAALLLSYETAPAFDSAMCCQQALALSKGNVPAGLINHEVRERPKFLEKLKGSHD